MSTKSVPAASTWVALAMVVLAVFVALTIAFVGSHTLSATVPLCDPHFPPRNSSYPNWAYVFASIAAFGIGHIAGQWGISRQGIPQLSLGEGRWNNPRAVLAVNAGVAFFLFVVTALLLFEAYTLGHHVWPITYYVRCANDAGPLISLGGVTIYAFVLGRWMWVFRE